MKNSKASNPDTPQRQRADRVASRMPVHVTCKNQMVDGVTSNISTSGVYFEVDLDQDTGSQIEFVIDLDTPGGPIHLHCIGEVVRVDNKDGKKGFATRIIKSEIKGMNPLNGS